MLKQIKRTKKKLKARHAVRINEGLRHDYRKMLVVSGEVTRRSKGNFNIPSLTLAATNVFRRITRRDGLKLSPAGYKQISLPQKAQTTQKELIRPFVLFVPFVAYNTRTFRRLVRIAHNVYIPFLTR